MKSILILFSIFLATNALAEGTSFGSGFIDHVMKNEGDSNNFRGNLSNQEFTNELPQQDPPPGDGNLSQQEFGTRGGTSDNRALFSDSQSERKSAIAKCHKEFKKDEKKLKDCLAKSGFPGNNNATNEHPLQCTGGDAEAAGSAFKCKRKPASGSTSTDQ